MGVIDQLFLEEKEIQGLLDDLQAGQGQQLITGLSGGSKAVFFKVIQQSLERPVLIVSPNMLQAQRTYDDLVKMIGDEHVHLYTAEELVAADFSFASYELRAGRIETLDHMARIGSGIYITPVAGLRKLLPTKKRWLNHYVTAQTDEEIDIEAWLEKLVSMGYIRNDLVSAPGEFALRGGILDIYPLTTQDPFELSYLILR